MAKSKKNELTTIAISDVSIIDTLRNNPSRADLEFPKYLGEEIKLRKITDETEQEHSVPVDQFLEGMFVHHWDESEPALVVSSSVTIEEELAERVKLLNHYRQLVESSEGKAKQWAIASLSALETIWKDSPDAMTDIKELYHIRQGNNRYMASIACIAIDLMVSPKGETSSSYWKTIPVKVTTEASAKTDILHNLLGENLNKVSHKDMYSAIIRTGDVSLIDSIPNANMRIKVSALLRLKDFVGKFAGVEECLNKLLEQPEVNANDLKSYIARYTGTSRKDKSGNKAEQFKFAEGEHVQFLANMLKTDIGNFKAVQPTPAKTKVKIDDISSLLAIIKIIKAYESGDVAKLKELDDCLTVEVRANIMGVTF